MPRLRERLSKLREAALEDAGKLAERGATIVLTEDAEDALVELLLAQSEIEETIKDVKRRIEESALAYNPNFKSVLGSKIKVGYRYYGDKYRVDDSYIDQLQPKFYNVATRYSADAKAVDEFLNAEKKLPLGIRLAERAKSITMKLRGGDDD